MTAPLISQLIESNRRGYLRGESLFSTLQTLFIHQTLVHAKQLAAVATMASQRKRQRNNSPCRQPTKCPKLHTEQAKTRPLSLLDLSAKCVAANIPFQHVEERCSPIPEPVQLKIVYWSFPRNARDICLYSSLHATASQSDAKRLPFQRGLTLLEQNAIKDVLQVGFQLSGKVVEKEDSKYGTQEEEYRVSVGFDRCKITEVSCTCGNKDILWCAHVVALSLFRIRNPDRVTLRVPISETLLQMNREQLQKLLQYLITEHHTEVLPTAQRLADEILLKTSEINRLQGAPDPTAGASADDESCWHLDAEQVRQQVRNYLLQGGYYGSGKHLLSMFAKVREMLRVHDKNGSRMLRLITEQFLADPRLQIWKEQGTSMNDKCRQLWDQLGALWVCVVLNPDSTRAEKAAWKLQLEIWNKQEVCPLENPDVQEAEDVDVTDETCPRRTVFSVAVQGCDLNWEDEKLKCIIGRGDEDEEHENLTWKEEVPMAAARVDALRAHGYPQEALRLAVAVARGMKEEQLEKVREMERILESYDEEDMEDNLLCKTTTEKDEQIEGWIGHPLEPIVVLYDTLMEEAIGPLDNEQKGNDNDTSLSEMRTFTNVPLPVYGTGNDNYLTLALEVALMGLGQQRTIPVGFYAQDKASRQEEHLIAQLNLLNLNDEVLYNVLKSQADLLLKSGPFSGLGLAVPSNSFPMHTFARFLFCNFVKKDLDLAFDIGLRAMRFLALEEYSDDIEDESIPTVGPYSNTRLYTLGHLQSQQCELASHLLNAAKDSTERLSAVLQASQHHIHSAPQHFRLAQEAFKLSSDDTSASRDTEMLHFALQLGLKVLRMTLSTGNWRRREMIQWLIECAVENGTSALSQIMKNWSSLFTPTEATSLVATTVMAPGTAMRLELTILEKEALLCCARALALQCASRDPQQCSLSTLTLCEKHPASFETAYRLVVESAAVIPPTQLFAIARYMDYRGYPHRAFKLASLAMKHFSLAYNQDSHPSIGDIHWTCALSQALGHGELTQIIPLIIKAVHCPTVLSDLLFRCTFAKVSSEENQSSQYFMKDNCGFGCDKEPLNQLMEATISAYVNTAHSRLNHISPKHYMDFVAFLTRAQETFLLASDGRTRFQALINNMKVLYKGKKKLIQIVKDTFG